MTELQIDDVYPKGSIYPMLVNFQNGYLTDAFDGVDCLLLEDNENKKHAVSEIDDFLYAGKETEEDLGKTFILARNKHTGKVRLIEASYIDFKPVLKIDVTSQEHNASYLELSRKFGSKKQRMRVEHREKLKVNVETVTDQMLNVTDNIKKDDLDLSAYDKNDSEDFYIPPINRNASKPEDVYDINRILTEELYERIYSELEQKDFKSDMDPWIQGMVTSRNMSAKETVLAVYANCLLKLYSTVVRELTKKGYTTCQHSKTLNEYLLHHFTGLSNGRRSRSAPLKDKALCHVIVLLLLLNNFKIDLDTLCQTAKLTLNTASMKVRATGATVVNTGGKKTVQLKLPLNTKTAFRRKSAKF